jgi:ATP-binding cassette subfamily F protein uup
VYDEMAAAASDHERVLTLDAALRELRDERAALEERWLELAELVD